VARPIAWPTVVSTIHRPGAAGRLFEIRCRPRPRSRGLPAVGVFLEMWHWPT